MCGHSDASNEIQKQQQLRQSNIQSGLQKINATFAGFDEPYYEGVRSTAMGTLMPQFARQSRNATRASAFNLQNRGLLNSSAAREQGNELAYQKGLGEIMVGNQAEGAVNAARQSVQQAKGQVIGQLISSEDPTLAAQQAVSAAASIAGPSITAPLGDLFQGFGNTYLAYKTGQVYGSGQPNNYKVPSANLPNNYTVKG